MKIHKFNLIIFIIIGFLFFGSIDISFAQDEGLKDYYEDQMEVLDYKTIKAKIIQIVKDDTKDEKKDIPIESDIRYQHLKVEILNGDHKGETYTVQNTIQMMMPLKLIFKENETMILRLTENEDGSVDGLKIYEKYRQREIVFIVSLFTILLILIGGMKGVKTILTLIMTVSLILFVFIPLIIKGYNPILVSIIICITAVTLTITIIGGINKKTITAILGTVAGVTIAAILAVVVGNAADLSGIGSEEAQMLAFIPQYRDINYQGLLFGGIIIGALGAIMDVAISISSSMWEIKEVQPKIESIDLIKSGMNIGKDIIGTMSNTLILAYVGTSIHLLIIFSIFNMSFTEVINLDYIASEVIRAMAGSIGLICAVPVTVLIAAAFSKKYEDI